MKRISVSILLMIVFVLAGLPGGAVLPAHAGASDRAVDTITMSNGIIITVDRYHHPPSRGGSGVHVSSTRGPAIALLQTVPAFAGVTFEIAGQQYVTGADGTAAVMVPAAGTYDLQVITDTFHDPYRRVEFSRWLSESYEPTRQVHLPAKEAVQVGLNVYELVGQKFVDLQGKPVAAGRIKQFTIHSIQGDEFTFRDGTPRWVPASRVTRRRTGGLQEVPLLWTVSEALIDGSNVVNKGQQQFYAQPNGTWTITTLLYNLRITTHDALFGFPQGSQIQLQYPNGRFVSFPLDKGSAQMASLARGNYYFQVMGAPAISPRAPIALSKDQQLDTRVISYLDLGVVAGFGIFVALALLVFGRFSLRRAEARRNDGHHVRILET